MGRSIRRYALLLALVAACAVAGCGSSDGTSTSSNAAKTSPKPSVPTRKQVVRMAQKYCRHGYKAQAKAVEAYAAEHGIHWREPSHAEREELDVKVVVPFVERKIEFWQSLPVPPGDGPQIKAIIKSMQRGLAATRAHPQWLAAPTPEHPEPFEETRALTGKYGAWICGQA